jgi:hypothetical protein
MQPHHHLGILVGGPLSPRVLSRLLAWVAKALTPLMPARSLLEAGTGPWYWTKWGTTSGLRESIPAAGRE